jgi:hypothetical protein
LAQGDLEMVWLGFDANDLEHKLRKRRLEL